VGNKKTLPTLHGFDVLSAREQVPTQNLIPHRQSWVLHFSSFNRIKQTRLKEPFVIGF
jgi:hypothetical protein